MLVWLALSSALGNPDFIIIPEFPLNYQQFKEKVKEKFIRNRNVIVVVAEGSRWDNNLYIAADESNQDNFGHPKFKGASEAVAGKLKRILSHISIHRILIQLTLLTYTGQVNQMNWIFQQQLNLEKKL